jgi:heme-binding protein
MWLRRIILGLIVFLAVIQVFRPAKTNPPVDPAREIGASMPVGPDVDAIFARACSDCHSNHTTWPWYTNVAPASWLVAYDVKKGRDELNFSEWGSYGPEKRAKLLKKICREVSEGEMPGLPYSLIHPRAKLTAADVRSVCRWTQNATMQAVGNMRTNGSGAE